VYGNLIEALGNVDKEKSVAEVKKLVNQGIDAYDIIQNGIMEGMEIVGQRFQEGEYFLPDLLLAAEAVKACSDVVKPLLSESKSGNKATIVMGTVAGDVHDLGKNIVGTTLESGGYKVVDIGVDVPREKFVEAVRKEKAQVLGLSALLTVTMVEMEKVIQAIRKEPVLKNVKIVVGGAPLDQEYADKIGADSYAKDARDALLKIRKMVG
jgi:corrinoid protein of di/trimethylamine methyltransferase